MKISCLEDLADYAGLLETKPAVAVVEAHEANTIKSVTDAVQSGLITPLLIGNSDKISELLMQSGCAPSSFNIYPANSAAESLKCAVSLINDGTASALMKGHIESHDFLKEVVNRDNNLLSGKLLSLTALFELSGYHKLLALSDIVLNTSPDLDGKKSILENAVGMLNALGIENPKVAVLAAVDKINPKMPETVDAGALKQMNESGEIANCIVEGPISFDLATSAEAARIKGYQSPVAGDADLLIVPDVSSGNILAKCLTGMAGARTAGTILGAKVPIILTSRSADAHDKYYSIALAACVAAAISS